MTATTGGGATARSFVWYVGYGSNLSAARLGCYLGGGRAPGAARTQPGARDATPAREDRPVDLPGTVYFAWESPTWGGGIAFYDHAAGPPGGPGASDDAAGTAAAGRGYLLGHDQVLDVLTQEMHRHPGVDPDPALDVDAVLAGRPQVLGTGRYERVEPLPPIEGLPALTLTSPVPLADTPTTAPSAGYLRVLADGLADSRGWDAAASGRYLAGLPGAAGTWTPAEVAAAVTAGCAWPASREAP